MLDLSTVKNRIIETSEIDLRGMLRPLLLYRGNITEGRTRSMWNMVASMMDANVPSVTEAVKMARDAGDYRHLCGVHSKSVPNGAFSAILSRIVFTPAVHSLIPGMKEYAKHLAHSSGAFLYRLEPIPEFVGRVRSHRLWRLDKSLLPHSQRQPAALEYYPYISGPPRDEHEMLMAVDKIVPRGLPNDVRSDVCQDMIVAILSGDATLENLKGDTGKYLKQFWQMFPSKYGPLSLDGVVPGTDDLRLSDRLSNKTGRLIPR